jgi:hypothetical protein
MTHSIFDTHTVKFLTVTHGHLVPEMQSSSGTHTHTHSISDTKSYTQFLTLTNSTQFLIYTRFLLTYSILALIMLKTHSVTLSRSDIQTLTFCQGVKLLTYLRQNMYELWNCILSVRDPNEIAHFSHHVTLSSCALDFTFYE